MPRKTRQDEEEGYGSHVATYNDSVVTRTRSASKRKASNKNSKRIKNPSLNHPGEMQPPLRRSPRIRPNTYPSAQSDLNTLQASQASSSSSTIDTSSYASLNNPNNLNKPQSRRHLKQSTSSSSFPKNQTRTESSLPSSPPPPASSSSIQPEETLIKTTKQPSAPSSPRVGDYGNKHAASAVEETRDEQQSERRRKSKIGFILGGLCFMFLGLYSFNWAMNHTYNGIQPIYIYIYRVIMVNYGMYSN